VSRENAQKNVFVGVLFRWTEYDLIFGFTQRRVPRRVLDGQISTGGVISSIFGQVRIPLVLRFFEVREHVLKPPAGVAHALPVVVVPLVAPHVQHGVQDAGAADHLTPSPTASIALHRLACRAVRLCLVLPVVLAAM